jgi:two-component system cell cycle sensor histidine kinase/response regulator CckA
VRGVSEGGSNSGQAVRRSLRVLLVEDVDADAVLVVRELKRGGYEPQWERVEDGPTMREALQRRPWDLVLSDWSLPHFSALAALDLLKEEKLDTPFVIVSGTVGEETAVSALRAGALDFVLKDKLSRLVPAIDRELREVESRRAHRRAEADIRRLEDQLRHSQKMEAVGRLAGGVAHDFNNVLSVILSYAEMLLTEMKPGEPMRDDVAEIQKAGKRAAKLTRQLLMFCRQHVLESKVLSLNELLVGVDNMLRRILGEDVELISLTAPSLGCVRVDPASMEQVIMNLVVNARDAMPTGGKVTIETANVELDEAHTKRDANARVGPHVALTVSDTGTGMDEETLARAFEPFFTTKPKDKGTGLGLSTVLGIVEQSGGAISVTSAPGKGTTFKILLPRVDAAIDARPLHSDASRLRGSETILLVEDEEQVRVVARDILRRHGYQVLEARNAGEALLLCERYAGNIDLLLSDVVMPQMSGPDLARRLVPERRGMKVLCMSGYAGDSLVHHGDFGADLAFLQKPLTPQTLTSKVREVLDGPPAKSASGTA